MKVRIERALYDRARACADAVRVPLAEWIPLALRFDARGGCPRVSGAEHERVATRGSVVARVNWPGPLGARELHGVLERVCAYCEARTRPPFDTPLREGVDYLVETESADV